MEINIHRLRTERRLIDAQIRLLKSDLRKRWTRPMADAQRKLLALQREATELCILRAWLRDKLHLPDDPERCRETALRRCVEFQPAVVIATEVTRVAT